MILISNIINDTTNNFYIFEISVHMNIVQTLSKIGSEIFIIENKIESN